jgi:hypothetical protein
MPDKWTEAMTWWRDQADMIKQMTRNVAVDRLIAHGATDIGTSDVNHEVYHMYTEFLEYNKNTRNGSIADFLVDAI